MSRVSRVMRAVTGMSSLSRSFSGTNRGHGVPFYSSLQFQLPVTLLEIGDLIPPRHLVPTTYRGGAHTFTMRLNIMRGTAMRVARATEWRRHGSLSRGVE